MSNMYVGTYITTQIDIIVLKIPIVNIFSCYKKKYITKSAHTFDVLAYIFVRRKSIYTFDI